MTLTCKFLTSIKLSFLHFGQNRGKSSNTVRGRICVLVLPPHFGQQSQSDFDCRVSAIYTTPHRTCQDMPLWEKFTATPAAPLLVSAYAVEYGSSQKCKVKKMNAQNAATSSRNIQSRTGFGFTPFPPVLPILRPDTPAAVGN